jgi:hypothetical protein
VRMVASRDQARLGALSRSWFGQRRMSIGGLSLSRMRCDHVGFGADASMLLRGRQSRDGILATSHGRETGGMVAGKRMREVR